MERLEESEAQGERPAEQAEMLMEQVQILEMKLEEWHLTDVGAMRRAYNSLRQHVGALDGEVQAVDEAVKDLDFSFLTPAHVARELGVGGGILWLAHGLGYVLSSHTRSKNSALLYKITLGAGLLVATWQLSRRALRQLMRVTAGNREVKERLDPSWRGVKERVAIMVALSHNRHFLREPPASAPALPEPNGADAPTAPAADGGAAVPADVTGP